VSAPSSQRLRLWMVAGLLLTAVLVNASDYSFLVPLRDLRHAGHAAVMNHRAAPPARYRVLVPFALDPIIRGLSTLMPEDKAFGRVYAMFHFITLAALLAALVWELRLWFSLEQAVVGALLVGSTIRLALRQGEYLDMSSIPLTSVFAPSSLLDPIVVALGVVLAVRQYQWWFTGLVAMAALNSEVAALLPLLYAVVSGVTRRSTLAVAMSGLVYAVVTLTVHALVGPAIGGWAVAEIWRENTLHLATTIVNLALFIGPLWILALTGLRHAPAEIRRAAWLVPVYLGVVGVWGFWWDVRLLMGLYPILVPLLLSSIFVPRSTARDRTRSHHVFAETA
jgi:hypothetical protein